MASTGSAAAAAAAAADAGAVDPVLGALDGGDGDKLSEAERVKDISKSPAFAFLDECVRKQILTAGQVAMYKREYEKVHESVLANYANETKCLAQSKSLKAVLEAERVKLDKRNLLAQDVQHENEQLLKDEKDTDTAVRFMDDECEQLRHDLEELTKQKDEARRRVEDKHRKGIEQLMPAIDNLKKGIDELRKDIQVKTDAIRSEIKESQKKASDIEWCQQQIAKNASLIEKKKHELSQAVGEPDRLKATIESLRIQALDLERGNEQKAIEIAKLDEREEQEQRAIQQAREAAAVHEFELDKLAEQIKAEQERVREVAHELDFARAQYDEDCLELQRTEAQLQQLKVDEKEHAETLKQRQKEHRDVKKDYETAARVILTYQQQIPALQRDLDAKRRDLDEKRAQLRLQKSMADEIHQDIELFYSQCLAQEKIDDDTKRQLDGVMADKKQLERKIQQQLAEEKQLNAAIAHLRTLRDNAAREASRAYNEKREMEETLKIKNIVLLDLRKQYLESQARLQKCEHDYEYIKNLANRTINLTQSRALALAELKERIKIKQNEEEILKNESRARQRALQDQARQIKIAANFLAAYKLEQNKYQTELKAKKDHSDQHNMEINKLLSIVELAEKEMVRLREAYARAVDRRNFTGIQLIDRNDELYVLYEKHAIQEQQLKTGDAQTKARDAEIGELQRQIGELQRRTELAKQRAPAPAVFAATTTQLKRLEDELKKAREQTQVLCEQLENPSGSAPIGTADDQKLLDGSARAGGGGFGGSPSKADAASAAAAVAMAQAAVDGAAGAAGPAAAKKFQPAVPNRCRVLKGVDPEPEQLAAKIEVLEERLNDKKEQLLERELVLDEVTSLSDKLRLQASEQRELTLELAKKVNEFQARIRAVNHKMMAAVSELSMYQAQAMKLEHTKSSKQTELKTARDRLAAGQPPTDDSEHEWYRKERDRIAAKEALLNRSRYQKLVATGGHDPALLAAGAAGAGMAGGAGAGPMARPRNTKADDRPNAYIPEDLGLPKPYFGSLAPFKPSVAGANMRHVRRPVPQPVQL